MKLQGIILRVWAITVTVLPTHKGMQNGDISLVGSNGTAGRVELYNNGQWGTICDDNWDIADAKVVCHQLGFRDAINAHGNALFGEGRGHIHISNVNCLGSESSLIECLFSLSDNCEHKDDAGVTCQPFAEGYVRLVGENPTNGRVEIFINGQWGTVCDDKWDILDAKVVCRQLGFKGAISAPRRAVFGEGEGPIHLDTVECLGDELSLLDCEYKQKSNCRHIEDAGVECFNVVAEEGNVRLTGNHGLPSRVEVYFDNQWGTVCDDDWNVQDATVVCRQVGLRDAVSAPPKATFGQVVGPIHLDSVKCSGDELSLLECKYTREADCTHDEDAYVVCRDVNNEEGKMRLIGGHGLDGRVEVFVENQWGTVCDDDWDVHDATVVCRQLGFRDALSAPRKATFGQGVGPIHLDSVKCSGDELSLLECEYKRKTDCTHAEDASVICRDAKNARGAWISIAVVILLLVVVAVVGITATKISFDNLNMNLLLRRIRNFPAGGRTGDDFTPEFGSRPTPDQRVTDVKPESMDCTAVAISKINQESDIKTDSIMYTTIPAELMFPTQSEETYEIPCNNLK